jgi:hypothetical protein
MSPEEKMKVEMVLLTPEMAEQLLLKNTHNRGVVWSRVDAFAADLKAGAWRVNGEAIKVASTGQMLDGQHRCHAVIVAEVPMPTLLITGLPPEAQETMDQGRSRSAADILKLRGEKDYAALAAATKVVFLHERDGLPFLDAYKAGPTVAEVVRTLERNPAIRESVALVAGMEKPWVTRSALSALHFLFASVSEEDATDFVTKLLRGEDLTAASPVWVLRERLMREHMERGARTITPRVKLAFVIRTWNAYAQGETMVRLQWSGGANPDRFPKIFGLVRPGEEA